MLNRQTISAEALQEALRIPDLVDPRERYADAPGFGWLARRFGWLTNLHDRLEGRYVPVYEDEFDLRALRMASWLLDAEVPVAIAVRERLIDYTIASGFDWKIAHSSPVIAAYINAGVQAILDASHWPEVEIESYRREVVDGEFLAVIDESEGDNALVILEGDNITEPAGHRELESYLEIDYPASWSFGVLTRQGRPANPLGYHVVRNESGTDWDLVRPERFIHWKRNATMNAKRGFPDSYVTHKVLQHGSKLATNTAQGAAIQAAIAYIVEHAEGTTATQASKLAAARTNNVVKYDPITGDSYNKRTVRPGQVVDIPHGAKYHNGLLGSNASTIYIDVMDAMFRLGGLPYAMPEHMLTGYAGNNNRASSESAESPFIQGRRRDQRSRAERMRALLMQLSRIVAARRYSWEEVEAGLEITVATPDIVSRDIAALTAALVQQREQGWVSDQQACQELGRDYEDTQSQLADELEQGERDGGFAGPPEAGSPSSDDPGQEAIEEAFSLQENCGTGKGGFKPGNRCARRGSGMRSAKGFKHKGMFGRSADFKAKKNIAPNDAYAAVGDRANAFLTHIGLEESHGTVIGGKSKELHSFHGPSIDIADAFLSRAVGPGLNGREVKFDKAESRRDEYDPKAGVIKLAGFQASPMTVVHEYGHHLESNNPAIRKAANQFIEGRVASGKPRVPMSELQYGYADTEVGVKGFSPAFRSEAHGAYAGMQYKDGSTEVVSMGLQALFENPVKLFEKDPEYANFMMGVLGHD